jgi:hypothetical protein
LTFSTDCKENCSNCGHDVLLNIALGKICVKCGTYKSKALTMKFNPKVVKDGKISHFQEFKSNED